MFAPPEPIQAEIFSRLPDRYRRQDVPSAWAAARRGGAPIPCFLEGPSFDRDSTLYVTDIPFGRVFRVSPNGIVLAPDGQNLYVAMTNANAVWYLTLMPNNDAIAVGTAIQLSGGIGPDGLALTEDGGLVVAHPKMGAVWVFNTRGEPIYRVNTAGSDFVTNVAFGGPDMRTLYITDSGAGLIQRARLPVAGRRMFSHSEAP